MSGIEKIVAKDSGAILFAKNSGKVIFAMVELITSA